MKKNIFLLEDDMNRVAFFKKKFDGKYNLIHADNVELAKLLFASASEYEIIFLDHDLGGMTFVDSKEEDTGYKFALFMKNRRNTFKYEKIVIHSMNPTGAYNIERVFDGWDRIYTVPFTTLKESLRVR